MKLYIPMAIIALSVVSIERPADAALTICNTSSACLALCRGSGGYCCPNGETQTNYTCPTGWTANILTGLCSRKSTSGSDTTGYYTQAYGTCNATAGTPTTCYDVYQTQMQNVKCFECQTM